MPLTVAVVRERLPGERRVALVPDTARNTPASAPSSAWNKAPGSRAISSIQTTG